MSSASHTPARPRPVERFAPTSGLFLGWFGIAACAVAIVWVALTAHTTTGLQVGLGAVVFGLVVWTTQLRPRALAYDDHLLLRNAVRDVRVPMTAIDDVRVTQSLQVWTGERRHVCIGIGHSVRQQLKVRRNRRQQLLSPSRWQAFSEAADRAAPDQTAMSYATFVETRITELVEAARKETRSENATAADVRRSWAWPELTALAVAAVALLVSVIAR